MRSCGEEEEDGEWASSDTGRKLYWCMAGRGTKGSSRSGEGGYLYEERALYLRYGRSSHFNGKGQIADGVMKRTTRPKEDMRLEAVSHVVPVRGEPAKVVTWAFSELSVRAAQHRSPRVSHGSGHPVCPDSLDP